MLENQECFAFQDTSRQSKLHYFSVLYGFNATCFGSYRTYHHQADTTPKKNYYVNRIVILLLPHI
jgi:hypothetical protein